MATYPTNIRVLNPSTLSAPAAGYSHVVEVTRGRIVFIAGQVALDLAGQVVGPHDFRAQTQQVFENIKMALTLVGLDFNHVIKLNIYLLDMSLRPILREIHDGYVNPLHPLANTLVEVRRLGREDFLKLRPSRLGRNRRDTDPQLSCY